jgi:hypothetical protein
MPTDDLNGSADQQSASPVDGLPAAVAEAIAGMRDDLPTEAELAGTATPGNDADTGRPADDTAARGSNDDGTTPTTDDEATSGQGDEDVTASDGAVDAGGSDDEADLAQYPEKVREAFRNLSRSTRKALYAEAEERARESVKVERDRADQLERDRLADEAKREQVRAAQGKYIGLEPTTTEDGRPLPSYDELVNLLTSRGGFRTLADKYGLSEDDAREQKAVWDERRDMLGSAADHLEDTAWSKLGKLLRTGLQGVEGIDPEAIVSGAQGPHDVVARLAKSITDRYEAREAKLVKDYEARLDTLRLNKGAEQVRSTARTPAPTTGGRSAGGPTRLPTKPGDIKSMSDKDFAAIENELLALIK